MLSKLASSMLSHSNNKAPERGSASYADLIDSTTFALQDDDLQELGGMTLGVLPWVSRQDLHQKKGFRTVRSVQTTNTEVSHKMNRVYLLAHAVDDLKVFGIGEQSVRVYGDIIVEQWHHI